ncbi:MAG: hypothetical protein Q9180_009080, partial [Flavoplaca navasiana]
PLEDISDVISAQTTKPSSSGSNSRIESPTAVKGSLSPSTVVETAVVRRSNSYLEQTIEDSVAFFELHDGKPIIAKGILGTAEFFHGFADKGYYSTSMMLLLVATTDVQDGIVLHVDEGSRKPINSKCTALLTSIIVVSFDKISEDASVGHWIVVHADLVGKLIRIYDSMAAKHGQLMSEDEMSQAYLRPINLIRESFPVVEASKTDHRIFLR